MTILLGSNIAALRGLRQLAQTNDRLSSVYQRLASGQRINKASDDAASLAIAESLRSDQRVYRQAIANMNDGISLLSIAEATVSALSDVVIRIQELAEQAANGSLSNNQRMAIDEEAQALRDEFFRVSRSAEFNGVRLFDGSTSDGIQLQAGYGAEGILHTRLGGSMGDGTFTSGQAYTTSDGTSAVETADFNGDGILDLVTSHDGTSEITVFLGDGSGSFSQAQTYNSGATAFSMRLADVNNDGIIDIATANPSDSVSILLGNGDGTFQGVSTYLAGDSSRDLAFADFNGDGLQDIVTANGLSSDVTVLLNTGAGTFSNPITYAFGYRTRGVTTGDFDGDGIIDVAATQSNADNVFILKGLGNGSFSYTTSYTAGADSRYIHSRDLNSDGYLDLVTSNLDSDDLSVFMGRGDGSFSSAVTYSTSTEPYEFDFGDVNSDGIVDIAVANIDGDDVTVHLGLGDGSFGPATTYTSTNATTDVALGDFDGDGILDFATANHNNDALKIFLGDSREGIAPILEFSLKTQAGARQAMHLLENKRASLTEQRGVIGSFQSRLGFAVNHLDSTILNVSEAESRIRDIDTAQESSALVRLSILQQVAASILTQANQQPALALKLLQG